MKNLLLFLLVVLFSLSLFSLPDNMDKPLKGQWDFQMRKLWETESAGDYVLAEIRRINTADDGTVYVLDSKNFKIHIFSKEGKYLNSFGSQGEGPGEIRRIRSGQLHFVDNHLIFSERGRLNFYSPDGKFERTVGLSGQIAPRAFISKDLLVSAPLIVENPRSKTAKISLYNLNDRSEKAISEYKPFEKATDTQESGGGRMIVGIIIGDITPMMIVHYHKDIIYFGMSDTYRIRKVDLKGQDLGTFGVTGRQPVAVSSKFKKDFKERLKDIPSNMAENILNGLPPKASLFKNITTDTHGNIYTFVSDPNDNTSQAVDIFSPDGKYLYSSVIKAGPGESITAIHIHNDQLILAAEDEEGIQKIIGYSINMP